MGPRFKVGEQVQYIGSDLKTLIRTDMFYTISEIHELDEYNYFYTLTIRISDNQPHGIQVHEHTLIKL